MFMTTETKIIIRNQSHLMDDEAVMFVARVLRTGRISDDGKSYCYHTAFGDSFGRGFGVDVTAIRNKKSDTFIVSDGE